MPGTGGTIIVFTAAESAAPVDTAAESAVVSTTSADTASEGWTSDLFSQPRPELGGSPVETRSACLRVYASTPVSIPVHTPYINMYVIQNKLVLS
jgi:hypothetical protein